MTVVKRSVELVVKKPWGMNIRQLTICDSLLSHLLGSAVPCWAVKFTCVRKCAWCKACSLAEAKKFLGGV